MNEIINKSLSVVDKFMPKIHFSQPGFTCSASCSFTKNKKRIQKIKETGDSRYIYRNELDKFCFQHGMVYEDLTRRKASDKILWDKAFNIAKNTKYDVCQGRLASMVYNFFHKKLLVEKLKIIDEYNCKPNKI